MSRHHTLRSKCFGPVTGAQLSGRQRHAPIFHRALARAVRTCSLEANAIEPAAAARPHRALQRPQWQLSPLRWETPSFSRWSYQSRCAPGSRCDPTLRHCHHPRLWPVQRRLQVRVAKAPPPPECVPGGGSPVRLHPTALLPSIIESVAGTVWRRYGGDSAGACFAHQAQRQGPAQSD